MAKKIGIVTIIDNTNLGNRLQNYAVQKYLENNNYEVETIKNYPSINYKIDSSLKYKVKYLKSILRVIKTKFRKSNRQKAFDKFNKNIRYSKKVFRIDDKNIVNRYDYFMTGSDQVWNPDFSRLTEFDMLSFAKPEQRIAFSASFGVDNLSKENKEKAKEEFKKYKAISVREDRAKEIVEEITGREDVQVLVDPTMLLTEEEWTSLAKKPEQLKNDKYILNYFLGELSDIRKNEIERIAKENNCEIINILDKNSPFYQTGPSEFLYLEKNAFLVCTDSFHSCIFAILFNNPFIIFDREDSTVKMNSRLDTLLSKFELKNRRFKAKITKEQLEIDYGKAYKILEEERKKTKKFIKKALD